MDPYQPPTAANEPPGGSQAPEKRHSVAGIISTVIGATCTLGLGGVFAFVVIRLSDFGEPTAAAEAEMLRSLVGVAVAMVIIAFLALIGAACAIAGLGDRERRRLFPVLGLALNSLVVLTFAICMVIGWAGSGQPG